MAKTKPFSAIFDKYQTYSPEKEGYGNVQNWSAAFDERMGYDDATRFVGTDNPLTILGLTKLPGTMEELKKVYRKLIMANQEGQRANATPEAQEIVKRIIAAYSLLATRIEKQTH